MRTRRTAGALTARPSSRTGWLLSALAAVLAGLVYANALHNPFVYDDRDTVVSNPSLVDLSNVEFILVYSPFRPLLNASYALDRRLWDYRPLGYHLTNVALHALAVVLLFYLLIHGLSDSRSSGGPGEADVTRAMPWAAFTGAAIFAVHPLMTEAVAYVSGRSEVLCAVWFLAALLLARRAMIAGSWPVACAAASCGVLSLASKEVAVALPVVVLAYDWLMRPGDDVARRRRLWRVFVPVVIVLVAVGLYRLVSLRHVSTGLGLESPVLNGLTQAIVIWRYLALLVWPADQAVMHSVHRASGFSDPLAWLAVAGLALLMIGALRLRRTVPLATFGVLWFFAAIAPSSSVVALREGMAEHRVYLASAGIITAATTGFCVVIARSRRRRRSPPYGFVVAVCAMLAVLSLLTVRRNQVWASPISLWTEAVGRAPGMWEPHYALADALREAGDCDRAVAEYRQVVAMRPAHRDAHTNLGICLGQTGRLEEAEAAFRRVIEIDPSFVRAYTNLGAVALLAGDPARARDYYREAIARDPPNVLARLQLAGLYERTFHDYHAAARMCGEARQLAPATPGVIECVERNQRLAAGR